MLTERFVFDMLLVAVLASAVGVFMYLRKVTAPYGRHLKEGWGPLMGVRAAWVVMEVPSVAVMGALFLISDRKAELVPVVFIALWQMHYVQRTFVFPFLIRDGSKQWPIMLVLYGMGFNTVNSYLNGRFLFHFSEPYLESWLLDPRFIAGVSVFFAGFAINLHSDHVLRKLRMPGETGYKVPRGGMFRYVSSPNYFGELLEWTGWAIATWSLPGLAFAAFTFANLGPRAASHHQWYRRRFPGYPRGRKAMIPFVY